jgi:hypothetical protein
MTNSNSETTTSPSPNGLASLWQGLSSACWSLIKSYGGLSALKKSNAELERRTLELRKENARLAELESKLDIVLRSSNYGAPH